MRKSVYIKVSGHSDVTCSLLSNSEDFYAAILNMFQMKLILLALIVALSTVSPFDMEEFDIESRIVNGKASARGQFPFYVLLEVQLPQGRARCGGSLISSQWVMSAGHCLKGAQSAKVILGSLRAGDTKEAGRKIIDVQAKDIHVHPKYFRLLVLK